MNGVSEEVNVIKYRQVEITSMDMDKQVNWVKTEISEFKNKIKGEYTNVNDRMNGVSEKVIIIKAQINQVEKKYININLRVDVISSDMCLRTRLRT